MASSGYAKWLLLFMVVAIVQQSFADSSSESKESKEDVKKKDDTKSDSSNSSEEDKHKHGSVHDAPPNKDQVPAAHEEVVNTARVRREARRTGGKFRPSPLIYG